jgi:hypothetical protein
MDFGAGPFAKTSTARSALYDLRGTLRRRWSYRLALSNCDVSRRGQRLAVRDLFGGRDHEPSDSDDQASGTFDATKFDDWLIGEHYAGCVVEVTFHAAARRYSGQVVFLFRFDSVDLIDRVNVFFDDADAISRFFG